MSYKLWLGAISLALPRHPSAPVIKKGQSQDKPVTGNRHEKRRITICNKINNNRQYDKERIEKK
jgi:hypothetical protein